MVLVNLYKRIVEKMILIVSIKTLNRNYKSISIESLSHLSVIGQIYNTCLPTTICIHYVSFYSCRAQRRNNILRAVFILWQVIHAKMMCPSMRSVCNKWILKNYMRPLYCRDEDIPYHNLSFFVLFACNVINLIGAPFCKWDRNCIFVGWCEN